MLLSLHELVEMNVCEGGHDSLLECITYANNEEGIAVEI
jgi:hypothetical protein